eukprot:g6179.t1
MAGHPNYASWSGFSMSSRYEALEPTSDRYACLDPAAELSFTVASCPSKAHASTRYACDFFATQESIRSCSSEVARYIEENSRWRVTFCLLNLCPLVSEHVIADIPRNPTHA